MKTLAPRGSLDGEGRGAVGCGPAMADPEPDPTEDAATAPTFLRLDADQVVRTVAELRQRIERRFPGSGLLDLSRQLLNVATQARERSVWIAKPILPLRLGIALLVLLIAAGIAGTVYRVGMPKEHLGFFSFVQVLESGINDVVLVAAGGLLPGDRWRRASSARGRCTPSTSCGPSPTSSTCTSSPRTRSG